MQIKTKNIRPDELLASAPSSGEDSPEDSLLQQQTPTALPTSSTKLLSKQHPLKTKWNFWFLNNKKKDMEWLDRLSKVCTVSTVEEFWAFFDNIRPPSGGMSGCDYNFFRDGIEPLWEVTQNKDGGRLVVQVDKQRNDLLDTWWMELLLACIGEQFGDGSDQVCGAVCNIRQKGSKISIWTTNASEEDKNRRIGYVIKERFHDAFGATGIKPIKVNFEDHDMVQQKSSSVISSRFII
ncbi:hypothetical protein GPALN_003681 [Globodera pallida]|nr:hypothetical protein GPALN_003681 [Globodera pallida]